MAKLGKGKKKKENKEIKDAPDTIKNRSKDVAFFCQINNKYSPGQDPDEKYVSDIDDWINVTGDVKNYAPESTVKWLKNIGKTVDEYKKVKGRLQPTGKKIYISKFNIYKA